jgi:ABC-type nickel/cobalt efflux system permease component RcnA
MTSLAVIAPAAPASAHPLGNATVNHYDGLHLYPDHVSDFAVEDIAEIPTLQRKPLIDTNRDGQISPAEGTTYAASQCAALARSDTVTVDGRRIALSVTSSGYGERPGAIQLLIGRLTCSLSAKAVLTRAATVGIDDNWDGAGIGWHEITAVATDVTLHQSPFPATSISDELLHYPNNLLSSPIDVRSGKVATTPGAGASTYAVTQRIPEAGIALRALNHVANTFNSLVGRRHVTIGVGLLALLLSMLLGAGHACLPGHGKSIMAAYLVGRRGRLRDVVAVGATVTITHTAGVLILGALISATTAFAPTEAEQDLGIASGLMVVAIGIGLMVSALIRRREPGPLRAMTLAADAGVTAGIDRVPGDVRVLVGAGLSEPVAEPGHHHRHSHDHPHPHPHRHPHPHGHEHPHGTDHHHGPDHDHGGDHDPSRAYSRSGLIGLGMAGGLVPSPSALLVLLATIALGRTVFGVVLVLGYGVGMALTLCAAGLLLVRLRGRLAAMPAGRRLAGADWLITAMPVLTSVLVLVVGTWLTLRAVGGTV